MRQNSRREVVEGLKERLHQLERSHRSQGREVFSTGSGLDRLLPGNGLNAGTLVEWLSEGEGTGAATLALALTARLLTSGGFLLLIDGKREFYPPAAAALGIPLEQTVIVQPATAGDALWALEQALRCRAVTVAVGWIEKLNDRAFRRLQLAAEAGGNLGFLLRPASCRAEPSWAELRLLVQASPASLPSPGRRLRIEVLHGRGAVNGKRIELELGDDSREGDADPVRVAAALAHPAPAPCPARA